MWICGCDVIMMWVNCLYFFVVRIPENNIRTFIVMPCCALLLRHLALYSVESFRSPFFLSSNLTYIYLCGVCVCDAMRCWMCERASQLCWSTVKILHTHTQNSSYILCIFSLYTLKMQCSYTQFYLLCQTNSLLLLYLVL